MVKLSLVTRESFEDFYQIFTELMKEGYSGFTPTLVEYYLAHDYSKLTLSFWLEKNYRRFSVAEDNGRMIGFLVGDMTYGGIGFISWVGVLKEYRGTGIGKQLVEEYEIFARGRRAHMLELFTYEKVKPFYTMLGFQEIGRRQQGYYGQLNIIMNKTIGFWDESILKLSV